MPATVSAASDLDAPDDLISFLKAKDDFRGLLIFNQTHRSTSDGG